MANNPYVNKVEKADGTTIMDISDTTATENDVLVGKSFYKASGAKANGAVDLSTKADKVSGATSGNFAGLDSNGNLTDSGSKASDFATPNQIPTKVSELQNDSGYTTNAGTITGITMNGSSKGTSGVVDLGTVVTDVSGKVSGPSSATNGNVVLFDGTTGKVIKDSGFTIGKSVPSNAVFTDHYAWSDITGKPSNYPGGCTGNAATATSATSATTAGSTTKLKLAGTNTADTNMTSVTTEGLNVRWYTQSSKIPKQPAQYGFLFSLSTADGGSEAHQLWFSQANGSLYHRGTNASSYSDPPAFKEIIDSSNIGSQTVSKASSADAVAWANVTGKPSSYYTLPLAANGTRGGVQVGFSTSAANRNYAVQLSSEKMYVNVPWTDHYAWSDITGKPGIVTYKDYDITLASGGWYQCSDLSGKNLISAQIIYMAHPYIWAGYNTYIDGLYVYVRKGDGSSPGAAKCKMRIAYI